MTAMPSMPLLAQENSVEHLARDPERRRRDRRISKSPRSCPDRRGEPDDEVVAFGIVRMTHHRSRRGGPGGRRRRFGVQVARPLSVRPPLRLKANVRLH